MTGFVNDPWRYRCPQNHTSWVAQYTEDNYRCETCGETFDELTDMKQN